MSTIPVKWRCNACKDEFNTQASANAHQCNGRSVYRGPVSIMDRGPNVAATSRYQFRSDGADSVYFHISEGTLRQMAVDILSHLD